MELRLPAIDWTQGSYGPVMSSRLWRRVAWEDLRDARLGELLDELAGAFEAESQECDGCGERFMPSRMAGGRCHGCAERGGAVF